jgi:ABC-type nickel/cobalt efflux system permease component RcnA
MISLLALALLLGMRHALEADHVAAVASLATRSKGMRTTVLQGVTWGLGHTLTLLVVGGICLLLRFAIPAGLAASLEGAVGVMLLYLGVDVLRQMRRRRIHFHVHQHGDGSVHFHAHRHAQDEAHDPLHHEHVHPHGFPVRALLVGLVHGLAGSAALLLLTVTTLSSPWLGVAYIAVFGVGSIAGMGVLAAIIALPLHGGNPRLARWAGWSTALEAVIGVSTVGIGAWALYNTPWVRGLLG